MSEVKVIITLGAGSISTGLAKIKAQFQSLRNDLNSELGSFLALGSLTAGIEKLIERGTELSNISRRFGAPAQELQRVTNVGRENGVQMEDVAKSWNKLAVNQQKAIQGNSEMREAFARLGISMQDVARMTVDQLFYRVADATATAEDRGKAYAAVVSIMGRNAGQLYTTLEKGSGVIKAQGDAIGVLSDKTIEDLHGIHTQIARMQQTLMLVGGSILVFFKNIAESIGAIVGEAGNEIGILIDLAKGAATTVSKLTSGLLHGNINLDTKDLGAALDAAKRNGNDLLQGKGLIGDFKSIWSPEVKAPEAPKKPLDVEIESTSKEDAQAEKLKSLREQLIEMQRKAGNEELTVQEKINALIAQRAALVKEAAGEQDEEKKLQLQIDAEKVTEEINQAIKERGRYLQQAADEADKEADKLAQSQGSKIASNSLRRIGGQESGGFAVTGIADKQLAEAKTQTKVLNDIHEAIKENNNQALNMIP